MDSLADGVGNDAVDAQQGQDQRHAREDTKKEKGEARSFELVGYVVAEPEETSTPGLLRLGTLRHLRDVVRLRRIDDVVFAADGLSNRTIFQLMQHLRGLPVQSRILAAGREHVIGKASIDDLSTPALIEAEAALGRPRGHAARRAFEGAVGLLGLVLHPFVRGLAALSGEASFWDRLAQRTRQGPAVPGVG